MVLKNIKELTDLMDQHDECIIKYTSIVKLNKTNRNSPPGPKLKFKDEFPEIEFIGKLSEYKVKYGQNYFDELEKHSTVEERPKKESTYKSAFTHINNYLMEKDGAHALQVYIEKTESVKYDAVGSSITEIDKNDLTYILEGYGPVKKSKEKIKESQQTDKAILPITLYLGKIASITIDGVEYVISVDFDNTED